MVFFVVISGWNKSDDSGEKQRSFCMCRKKSNSQESLHIIYFQKNKVTDDAGPNLTLGAWLILLLSRTTNSVLQAKYFKLQTLWFLRTFFSLKISVFSSFSATATYLTHTASYWNHLFNFCISYLRVILVKFSHNPIGKGDVV
jgi:hypothetical protein